MKLCAALLAFGAAPAMASCGSAFCLLNTNWSAQGVWLEPGMRLDLRYEYIDQDELFHAHGDEEDHQELGTTNRNLLASLDYSLSDRFGINVSVPLVSRTHEHLHVADGEVPELESWDFVRLGDLRLQGRLQLSAPTQLNDAYGITLGLKLPTGDYQLKNSEGELAERSLQPGTGTTDMLWGGYYRQLLPNRVSQWFVQLSAQQALSRRDEFRPGKHWQADLGYSYQLNPQWRLQTQLNYGYSAADTGANAEPENSGHSAWFLSPGFSYGLSKSLRCYGFVQHRLALRANGTQLVARDSLVLGTSWRF